MKIGVFWIPNLIIGAVSGVISIWKILTALYLSFFAMASILGVVLTHIGFDDDVTYIKTIVPGSEAWAIAASCEAGSVICSSDDLGVLFAIAVLYLQVRVAMFTTINLKVRDCFMTYCSSSVDRVAEIANILLPVRGPNPGHRRANICKVLQCPGHR